jgi:hypothetical protein
MKRSGGDCALCVGGVRASGSFDLKNAIRRSSSSKHITDVASVCRIRSPTEIRFRSALFMPEMMSENTTKTFSGIRQHPRSFHGSVLNAGACEE